MPFDHPIDCHAGLDVAVNSPTRDLMAAAIASRLERERSRLIRDWQQSGPVHYFVVDNLLQESLVQKIYAAFPAPREMVLKKSLREVKYVAAQMNHYDRLLEECIYSFQAPSVLQRIHEITDLRGLEPDDLLYAGGISTMAPGHFLNPHVDNSHDKFRSRYRVLNLLFYVTPNWRRENGGNLELWPAGPKRTPITIDSLFNRLVVMVTHQGSWHSVSRNVSEKYRCCISNYYFSDQPIGGTAYFHVTSFRGRPEERIRDLLLRTDSFLRMGIRRLFPLGVKENKHFYRKP